ncbi:GDSL-type esterase/lipase family protein [uncultured Roseovarius sp.]|uniref:DUF459 domain-containing protein n=1 Tax=uncultured Roseovarius sp. TaxID=293344 RepID=UPI002628936E|nr:GDSL-type esterase/lipase family protein [uncultured Roseovarius sp.]
MICAQPGRAAQATLSDVQCPDADVTIAVLGDSLADGIWGAFWRSFSRCGTVEVMRSTTVSDGLAHSGPESWLSKLGGVKPDLTVLSIGANDLVNMREGRTRFIYGQADWKEEYTRRANQLASSLNTVSDSVVWLGLPVVGRRDLEQSYREVTELQERAATEAGVRYVDTHMATTFGQGKFVMTANVGGSPRQLRHSDQVHFTEIGYDLVAGLMRRQVADTFERASRDASMRSLVLQ